jgi:hypothetical protein
MDDVRSFESSVNFYQNTRSHVPEMVHSMATAVRILSAIDIEMHAQLDNSNAFARFCVTASKPVSSAGKVSGT